jgi:hypothetical protein
MHMSTIVTVPSDPLVRAFWIVALVSYSVAIVLVCFAMFEWAAFVALVVVSPSVMMTATADEFCAHDIGDSWDDELHALRDTTGAS